MPVGRAGHTFVDWDTAADGSGTAYDAGDTYAMPAANMTLYAQWTTLSGMLYRDMVAVSGGTFSQDDGSSSFSHTISPYQIGMYEVTYELWYAGRRWALANGYAFANAGREGHDGTVGAPPTAALHEPVTTINWRDALVWCNAYSELAGLGPVYENGSGDPLRDSQDANAAEVDTAVPDWSASGYRLQTEGEYQFASRYVDGMSWLPWNHVSGDTTSYCDPNDAGVSTVFGDFAWHGGNSGNTTHDVGTKTANQLGIYDMSGSVSEWIWGGGAYPTEPQTDYRGTHTDGFRMLQGGRWSSPAWMLEVGARSSTNLDYEAGYMGLRVVRQ